MFVVPAKTGTQRLSAPPKTHIKSQSRWVPAFAGTTDSGALHFKASFKITIELLHSIFGAFQKQKKAAPKRCFFKQLANLA